jgi:hypothetical protein
VKEVDVFGDFYSGMGWLLVDIWWAVFQTDKMENQGAVYYLRARELIPGCRWLKMEVLCSVSRWKKFIQSGILDRRQKKKDPKKFS